MQSMGMSSFGRLFSRTARTVAVALVLAGATALGGCGFELRGQTELPDDVRTVYVDGPDQFVDELETFISGGGAEVISDAEKADAVVTLGDERYERRVLSADPQTGKDREFELVYLVNFTVTRPDGTVAVGPEQIRLSRDYVFDSDAVLGKSREEGVLRVEMRRDAAEELVRRIEIRLR